MFKKFKLSAVVLALLTFSLMLFYQNCAQQSEDLGGFSSEGGNNGGSGTTPSGSYQAICSNNKNASGQETNIFSITFKNVGRDAVATATPGGVSPQLKNVPSRVCPTPTCGGPNYYNEAGTLVTAQSYVSVYGPWVRLDCDCMKTPTTHGYSYVSAINGYSTTTFDLTAYASIDYAVAYVKNNVAGPYLEGVNGAHAFCDIKND